MMRSRSWPTIWARRRKVWRRSRSNGTTGRMPTSRRQISRASSSKPRWPGAVAQNIGDADKAMAGAATKVEATYQPPVPGACHDGADELHGARPQGRLRNLDRHPGDRARPGDRRKGCRPAAREGHRAQSSDRRRLWPAAGGRRRGPRGRDRQACRWSGEGRVDARGRHPARHVPALLVRPHFGGSRRAGQAGGLE